jgi:hypothetical protein
MLMYTNLYGGTHEYTLLQPLKDSRFVIPKSRYDSVDSYLSEDWINRPEYNDTNLLIDEGIYKRLKDHGQLLRWVSHFSDGSTGDRLT